jgi:hypothetical protein
VIYANGYKADTIYDVNISNDSLVFVAAQLEPWPADLDEYSFSENKIKVYPNPFINKFNIRLIHEHQTDSAEMLLISLNGSVILKKIIALYPGDNNFSVDCKNLIPGNYILLIQQQKSSSVRSIIKY